MSGVTYHQVQQGSPEWLALRATHYTASEAPAMMGVSPYQSRSELLRAKNTGMAAEIDAHTQRRFDDGHRAEAAARPLAEAIIKDDLYPATVSTAIEDLPLLASLDGVTMDGKVVWEHKLWNEALAEAIRDGEEAGQQKLAQAKILVVGAGALGCPVLMYLTAAGVGTIGVLDSDEVDESNLHRQILYTENDIGKPKVAVAYERLRGMNSEINILPYCVRLHRDNVLKIFSDFDVIVECSDNFPTKFLVNDACVILGKPCIIGGVMRFSGQLSVYNFKGGPTYRCLLAEEPDPLEAPSCSEAGVIGMVPGIIGTMQALEALKIVTGMGVTLSGRLLNFDGLSMSFTEFDIELNPDNLKISELSDYEYSCSDDILKGREIDADAFLEMLNSDTPPVVLAFADDGIPITALAYQWDVLPLYELPNLVENLPRDNDLILICNYGLKSLAALRYLVVKHKLERVYNLKDGISTLKI